MEDKLVLARNFLYKFFVAGFVILILSAVIYIFAKDYAIEMSGAWYGIDPEFIKYYAFVMLGLIKVVLIFFVLTPALALHWLICCCKKKNK